MFENLTDKLQRAFKNLRGQSCAAAGGFSVHEEELRVAHDAGYDGDPEADRDAVQPDCSDEAGRGADGYAGFFNFNARPWVTQPTPQAQVTKWACYADHLP